MRQVRIVTDSTCDLSSAICEELGITVVPLTVYFGEVAYRDRVDLDSDQFLRMLARSGELPKTSQPSPAVFEETYRRLAADGSEILSLHLSARLSGTVHAAEIARDALRGKAHIEVIDAGSASLGLGLIVMAAARLARQGAEIRDIASLVRRLSPNVHILFVVDTLEYLQRGGRIGRANALLGALLNIRPILKLEDGEIHPVEKVRTRSKAIDRLVEFVELFPHIDELAVVYSAESPDLEALLRRIEPIYPRERIVQGRYGPVVGTHAGPNGLGVIVSQGVVG
ncbi:MAG TPA: DegV family protein [Chloroflexota bacterium]|nr:DegV family protein [Chloroflexota bacterium]